MNHHRQVPGINMGDTSFHYKHNILILHTYCKGSILKHTLINTNITTFFKNHWY